MTTATPQPSIEMLAYQLRDLVLELHDEDPREIALDYAFAITQCKREEFVTIIQEFQNALDERNSSDDDE